MTSQPDAKRSPVTRHNLRTVGLLLLAATLGGLGIGLAFSRWPFADSLVLASVALALAAVVSRPRRRRLRGA